MKIEKGYIYIMQLSEQKDIVKIGKTSDHPYHRADTLSKNTAAISSFTPYFYLKVLDTTTAERKAHKLFDGIRKDAKKEYFKLEKLGQLNLMVAQLILDFGKNSDLVDHEDSEGVYWKGYKLIPYKEAVEIASSIFIVKEIHGFEIALKYATD